MSIYGTISLNFKQRLHHAPIIAAYSHYTDSNIII
jgi:hypothetical protein